MKRIVDLHTHSTASDGQHRPAELVGMAKERGIEVLALTDHDTVDGLTELEQAGSEQSLTVIRGVELGAMEHRNFHILGYGFSKETPNIARLCAFKREQRNERNRWMVEFLQNQGVDIALEEVAAQAGGEVIDRPHFAQIMVRRGYVANNREAFDRYLDTKEYDSIRVASVDARTCVETIKADGGKVSLARPYQLGYSDEKLEETVRQLADWGLDAIECHYPKHTLAKTAFYLELAQRYGLHVTGGSDFHGEKVKLDISLARVELDVDWLL